MKKARTHARRRREFIFVPKTCFSFSVSAKPIQLASLLFHFFFSLSFSLCVTLYSRSTLHAPRAIVLLLFGFSSCKRLSSSLRAERRRTTTCVPRRRVFIFIRRRKKQNLSLCLVPIYHNYYTCAHHFTGHAIFVFYIVVTAAIYSLLLCVFRPNSSQNHGLWLSSRQLLSLQLSPYVILSSVSFSVLVRRLSATMASTGCSSTLPGFSNFRPNYIFYRFCAKKILYRSSFTVIVTTIFLLTGLLFDPIGSRHYAAVDATYNKNAPRGQHGK